MRPNESQRTAELAGFPASELSAIIDKLWIRDLSWVMSHAGIEPNDDMSLVFTIGFEVEGHIEANGGIENWKTTIEKARKLIASGDEAKLHTGKEMLGTLDEELWGDYQTLRHLTINTTLMAAGQSRQSRRTMYELIRAAANQRYTIGINKQTKGGGSGFGEWESTTPPNPETQS